MTTEEQQEKYLEEIRSVANRLRQDYGQALPAALHERSVLLGRLSYAGIDVDAWLYAASAVLLQDPKIPEWKYKIMIQETVAGRIARIRQQAVETIKAQMEAITSELIEMQSDRKHSSRQQT